MGLLWPVFGDGEGAVLLSLPGLEVSRGMGPAFAARERAVSFFFVAVD